MDASARFLVCSAHFRRHLAVAAAPELRRRRPLRPTISASLRTPTNPSLSLSASHFTSSPSHFTTSNSPIAGASHFSGDLQPTQSGNPGGVKVVEKVPALTAVLLGWLGSEEKHLRRYAELYGTKVFRTVAFSVRPGELLGGFDLGRRVEERIARLADELVGWLDLERERERERGLLFHSFSNTGWLVYGALLEKLQERGDYIRKIRGCVVDSGGDPDINPQVWAAGFTAALLKKRSSLNQSESADKLPSMNEKQEVKVPLIELITLSVLEMIFAKILKLPYVQRRLSQIISILKNEQPFSPQLYLYSTADKVVPVQSIEYFIEQQRHSGRKVQAYNFVTSPHVDHLRSFPHIYKNEIDKFVEECCVPVPSK